MEWTEGVSYNRRNETTGGRIEGNPQLVEYNLIH